MEFFRSFFVFARIPSFLYLLLFSKFLVLKINFSSLPSLYASSLSLNSICSRYGNIGNGDGDDALSIDDADDDVAEKEALAMLVGSSCRYYHLFPINIWMR